MECFSGMGGMMRVGWRATSVALSEANSLYRLRTSMSWDSQRLWQHKRSRMAYSGANGVSYVAASTLSVLAGMDNLNVEVGVLVEDLLDTTVVATFLGFDSTRLRHVLVVVVVVVIMLVVAVLLVVVEGFVVVGRLRSMVVGCRVLRTTRA
jgi:hypothetical protein